MSYIKEYNYHNLWPGYISNFISDDNFGAIKKTELYRLDGISKIIETLGGEVSTPESYIIKIDFKSEENYFLFRMIYS